MASGSDPTELLKRHVPLLRYDSQEPYFADAASEWTDNPGNVLRRKDRSVIAATNPTGDQAQLALSFLGPDEYGNTQHPSADDYIGVPSHNYVAQAQAMHAKPAYANRVYGHTATGDGARLWLAYWFFYFYNDYNLIGPFIKAGLHEGDWEMIQLRIGADGQTPDLAVYAQHTHAERRPWTAVERVGDQPVVYPARGSHASYFTADVHWTGAWFDFADGKRAAPALELEIISDAGGVDGWARWPGTWGGTQPPKDDINPMDDSSPRGPGGHKQFTHPDVLLQGAVSHVAALAEGPEVPEPAPAPAPTVTTSVAGDDLDIHYDTHVPNPAGLVVTIGDANSASPPEIHQIPIDTPTGVERIPGAASAQPQSIHVSVATQDKAASRSVVAPAPS